MNSAVFWFANVCWTFDSLRLLPPNQTHSPLSHFSNLEPQELVDCLEKLGDTISKSVSLNRVFPFKAIPKRFCNGQILQQTKSQEQPWISVNKYLMIGAKNFKIFAESALFCEWIQANIVKKHPTFKNSNSLRFLCLSGVLLEI